jgi:hypothetical protein
VFATATLAEGRRRFEARDYAGALAYADAVLANDPSNSHAVALKKMSEGRVGIQADVPLPATNALSRQAAGVAPEDRRPYRLNSRIPSKAIYVPASPTSLGQPYVGPDVEPPSTTRRLLNGVGSIIKYNFHRRTPEEAARLSQLTKRLESTPSGRRIVEDLGGWDEIGKHVDITFSPIANPTVYGYVRPLFIPDSRGRRLTLVLNSNLLNEADEAVVPILAHELTHIQHHLDGRFSPYLAIPSEFAAHRNQVYVFIELSSGLRPEQTAKLEASRRWSYQRFMADLWQDRIRERFPDKKDFVARYIPTRFAEHAAEAYDDIISGKVQVGSPHLDHHVAAPDSGVYTVFTDEKDILDEVNVRKARPGYSDAQQEEDDRMLRRRSAIILPMDQLDSDYRYQNGWRLE